MAKLSDKELQKKADRYAHLHLKRKEYKREEDELREELLPYLKRGCIPSDGQCILVYSESERCALRWKEYATKLAKKLWPSDWKAKMNAARIKAGVDVIEEIEVRPNPKYKEN